MKHIVTSRDNVQFVVNSDARTVPFDQSFAAARMAEALDTNPDFSRLGAGPLEPLPPSPAERRAAFRLIQGGRS